MTDAARYREVATRTPALSALSKLPRIAPTSPVLLYIAAIAASVLVGFAATNEQPFTSPVAAAILLLAFVSVALSLAPEHLLVIWLAAAPFLQESSHANFIGDKLNYSLYRLPPLILLVVIALRHSHTRLRVIDFMPGLYLFYLVISESLISSNSHPLASELRGIYLTVAIGILIYYFIVFGPTTSELGRRVAQALIGSGILISLMTIFEGFTGWNLWHDLAWQQADPPRAVATLANPATLGTFLGMAIAFALAILLWDGPKSLRKLSVVFLFLALPALFLTYTRGPMIALAATALCMVLVRTRTALPSFAFLILLAAFFIASWNHISSSSVYESRFGVTDTAETRLALQEVSIKLAEARPVTGWGLGSFDSLKSRVDVFSGNPQAAVGVQGNTSHDTFLTILVELGALGFLVLFIPWVVIAWSAIKAARYPFTDRWVLVAALGALGVYVISAGTLDMRFFSFVPMLAWLALGLARRTVAEREMQCRVA